MRRWIPWLHVVVCAAGLPVYLWAFSHQIRLSALPDGFPPADFDYPARLADFEAGSLEELRFLAESLAPDAATTVVFAAGQAYEIRPPRMLSPLGVAVTLLGGLFFWAVSAFVFARRTTDCAVRGFFWCTFLYGLAIMIGGVHFPAGRSWPVIPFGLLQIACLAVLPPIFVHLTLIFPRRQRRAQAWLLALLALAAVMILWQSAACLRYFRSPTHEHFTALALPQGIADGLLVAEVLAGFLILYAGSRRLELARERAQVKWLLWGFAMGVTPYVFLRTLPGLWGLAPPFDPAFDRLLELAIPIAFVFAVVRYQFLDIDIIIRRSVIYVSLALLMIVVYLAMGVLISRAVQGSSPEPLLVLAIAIGAGAGLMFQPLRRGIGKAVDRTVFKLTHLHGQALAELIGRMESVHARSELTHLLDEFLVDALAPQRHAVVLREGETYVACGSPPVDAWIRLAERGLLSGWGDIVEPVATGGLRAAPNSTSTPEIELAELPDSLAQAAIVIVQPLGAPDSPTGAMLLGRKRTDRRYIEPDLNLLRRAAVAAGSVLERIELIQAAAAEAQARRQAEELDRLKSDFLSRVAHDLRTPLASILWSTENLLDGISGPVTDDQGEYLRAVRASAGHLNRLVDNLLEISRLEQGRARFELEPVRLDQVVQQGLLTLQPLAQEKQIRLCFEAQAGGPVRGNAEKLLEVVLNLVDNAIKYSPRDGEIAIRIAPAAAGWQELSVRDHGPGLGDLDPELLFERFRQGTRRPAAQQQGFGLGLYIVRSYVELMGGEVTAANHPAGGAIFTCRLPEEGNHHESERADRG